MADPFMGELRVVGFSFAPKGWALCNGQILSIAQNQALFSLFGTTYGGDGRTTFGLPNLQGRTPFHVGPFSVQGAVGGETVHTLVTGEIPQHNHIATAGLDAGTGTDTPLGNFWGTLGSVNQYKNSADTTLNGAAVTPVGNNQPHQNMQPYLVLNIIVALQGLFPSRN